MRFALHLFIGFCLCLPATASLAAYSRPEIVLIGVLAKRGKKECSKKWGATVEYLNKSIPEYRFLLARLTFEELPRAVAENKVQFTLSNPAMYVELEYKYGVTRIATLKNKIQGRAYTRFGGVIFTRSDRQDINGAEDLAGKRFMAVNPGSFGGWQVAWRHLQGHGIRPRRDFMPLLFGNTHDAVVYAVENGKVDAGTVRTDTLERMAREGKITLQDFKVLDQQPIDRTVFPFLRTTRLYPEWPFAKTRRTSEDLARKVAIALLAMEPESTAARNSNSMGWTIPLDYSPVHACLKALHIPPYEHLGEISLQQILARYWPWIAALFCFALFLTGLATYVLALNRRLKKTMNRLDHELLERKQIVADLNAFKQTLDQILDCVFMFDPDTLEFNYANQGALLQVGYSYGELFAMTPVDIKPEFDKKTFRRMIAPLLDNQQESMTFSTVHRHKDGHSVPVEIFLQYVQPAQRQGTFVSVVRDISQRLVELKEKEQLQARLLHTQKLESVGQLAAGIAHEINTPTQYIGTNINFLDEAFADLTALIKKFLALLTAAENSSFAPEPVHAVRDKLEEVDWEYLAEEIPEAISQTKDGVHRVSSIVQAMKEFSHPGSKEKTAVDLNRLIETTMTVARNEWKYLAEIKTDFAENLPNVPCFSDELGQVMLNLLVNAAHGIAEKLGANPEGKKGTINLSTRRINDMVEIRITDNGIGIPEAISNNIFDPFFTTKEVGKGTGQGLAIARDVIVNKHGGTLEVESGEGKGATFILCLPL